eukprot:13415825-Alexandrium_andersonii.AAC.1
MATTAPAQPPRRPAPKMATIAPAQPLRRPAPKMATNAPPHPRAGLCPKWCTGEVWRRTGEVLARYRRGTGEVPA